MGYSDGCILIVADFAAQYRMGDGIESLTLPLGYAVVLAARLARPTSEGKLCESMLASISAGSWYLGGSWRHSSSGKLPVKLKSSPKI